MRAQICSAVEQLFDTPVAPVWPQQKIMALPKPQSLVGLAGQVPGAHQGLVGAPHLFHRRDLQRGLWAEAWMRTVGVMEATQDFVDKRHT